MSRGGGKRSRHRAPLAASPLAECFGGIPPLSTVADLWRSAYPFKLLAFGWLHCRPMCGYGPEASSPSCAGGGQPEIAGGVSHTEAMKSGPLFVMISLLSLKSHFAGTMGRGQSRG
jgi:hypothetical protein